MMPFRGAMSSFTVFLAVLTTIGRQVSGGVVHPHPASVSLLEANLPEYEIDVLNDMYNSLNGPYWEWGQDDEMQLPGVPWNFSSGCNPCAQQWQGVNCTGAGNDGFLHIGQLILFQMELYGTLPESLGLLSELELLNVGFNTITGSLPAAMGNLTRLNTFIAEGNDFTGRVPSTVEALSSVVDFNVYDNYFTGPLPNVSLWTKAQIVNLSNNKFNGTIAPYFGYLSNLQQLLLENNFLTGSLPEELGQLAQLQKLICNGNYLTGTIPSTLGNLSRLKQLMLNANLLHGTIPAALGQLGALQYLYLYSNQLNSTIPAALGTMSSLLYMSLQANRIHGTIPSSLCNLTTMSALRAQNNYLTGTLPACLVLNPAFAVLVLYNNAMSGPLPNIYATGSKMNYFDVNGYNYFTGTLPEAFSGLTKLNSIYVGGNQLTGTIPVSYGEISALVSLYVVFNRLTGVLPASLGALSNLQLLEVSGNEMYGTLPASLGALTQLLEIHADSNHFTGTIPPSLTALSLLQTANLFSNHLHGAIPEHIGNMTQLVYLGFDGNMLTGTVPESIGALILLENLELYNNRLRGTLPGSIRNLTSLTNLLLQSNHLSGSLDGRFSSDIQTALSVIQLSNNQFTGSIPDEAFHTPRLKTFAAVSNCFEGSLPRSACTNTMVQVLAMSGLQSSPACQQKVLPGIAKSYVIRDPIAGGIPDCLFQIPSLTTLQLAGNGLTGTLPDDIEISPSLRDLSLSHNTLSGTIPSIFQQRGWDNFDVSFNRLYGTLEEKLEVDASYNFSDSSGALSLENNRLSGDIPNSIKNIVNISILSGNLFTCSLDQGDLPTHDSAAANYECGSTTFNVPYFLWFGIVGLLLLLATGTVYATRAGNALPCVATLTDWLFVLDRYDASDVIKVPLLNLRYAIELFINVGKIALLATAYAIILLLPLYAIMSTYYGTLEHQYAYAVSAAYHTGTVPLALELVFLVLLQCVVLISFAVYLREPAVRMEEQVRQSVKMHAGDIERKSSLLGRVAVYCALLLTNTAVVVGVNVAYVYIALYQSSSLLLFAQIVLSVFKLAWNKFSGTSLIPWTARYVSPSVTNDLVSSSVEFFPLQLFLSLFNNIAIPCLVVAVVSPNCFSNVFTESPSVDSTYVVYQCLVVDNVLFECDQYYAQQESTAFNPPFTYSYQCSASFITYYAPAFVIMCIMSTFGLPAVQSVIVYLHTRETALIRHTGEETWRYRLLDAMLPTLLKPPPPPPVESVDLTPEQARQSLAELEERWTVLQKNIYSPHFPANQVLLNMLTFLGILLTFGVMFPPLAAALAVTAIGSGLYARLKVGRFLTAALQQKQVKFFDLVDQECRGVGSLKILLRSAFMLLAFSCCFYTLFLFDTYGDAVGLEGAYWVLIVMPLLPVMLYVAFQLSAWKGILLGTARPQAGQEPVRDGKMTVELQPRRSSVRKTVAFQENAEEVDGETVNAIFVLEKA